MIITAIETSCDETAIAVIQTAGGGRGFRVLSNLVLSQANLHAEWGGVVPNLAKREHEKALVPMLLQALDETGLFESRIMNYESRKKNKTHNSKFIIHNSILEKNEELRKSFEAHITSISRPNIDIIAVTQGPGLEPALWVGVNFARALSALWNIPLLGVNHMEGHIVSARIAETDAKRKTQNVKLQLKTQKPKTYHLKPITCPALALLVSGGHTELVLMKKPLHYEIIGETRDDAAGEAFDKVARLLGLPYPGGPAIAQQADLWNFQFPIRQLADNFQTNSKIKNQNSKQKLRVTDYELRITLPRPMINTKDFDFSFSGLKTAVLYLIRDLEKCGENIKKLRPAICKEFQDAVVDVLVAKTIRAAKEYKAKTILLGGGVAANKELRKRLAEEIKTQLPRSTFHVPRSTLTGDNALMIAVAAMERAKQAKKTTWKTLKPDANMRF